MWFADDASRAVNATISGNGAWDFRQHVLHGSKLGLIMEPSLVKEAYVNETTHLFEGTNINVTSIVKQDISALP